jgi:conjugal transfer pilus assembly protein TraW
MEKSGELERLKNQAKERIEGQILEPAPIAGIGTVDRAGVRYFDPTFVLGEDIFDHEGNRMAAKGTRVNPLEVMPVRKKLFFFDGRSDVQVALAAKLAQTYGNDFTPILTAGSWVKTSEKLQQAVFYDQLGKMSTRLTVTAVPALVSQDGLRMKIEEIKP